MPDTPSVTVAVLLGSRAEALGLRLEVLGGAAGLGRPITSPHVQKTGLAFAGYEEYLTRMETTLGEAYAEPAADVRGYVASVKGN